MILLLYIVYFSIDGLDIGLHYIGFVYISTCVLFVVEMEY